MQNTTPSIQQVKYVFETLISTHGFSWGSPFTLQNETATLLSLEHLQKARQDIPTFRPLEDILRCRGTALSTW